MDLFPAIDLRRGRVVRLVEGRDEATTVYGDDPAAALAAWRDAGAGWTHVVDLDAAFGEAPQREMLERLLALPGRPRLQVGGGFRSPEAVEAALALGVDRVVVGSFAVREPAAFGALARRHPGRLVPALDVRAGEVRTAGWQEEGRPWRVAAAALRGLPCPAVLVTAIERDGTLEGPDLALTAAVAAASGIPALVSGGVARLADVVAAGRTAGVGGVVVGKALYEGRFDLVEALAAAAAAPMPSGPRSELAARVIPCLDVADGRVVKGVRFQELVDQGDIAEAARRYAAEGADELVFLDVSASHEARDTRVEWVERVAREVFVPLTVGGGVRGVDDARRLLLSGADKVGINSAAVADPVVLGTLAGRFGRQCVVLSVDARRRPGGGWEVVTHGGRRGTGRDVLDWLAEGVERGAGEVLLTSIDADGTRGGYDLELLAAAAARVRVPVIASGGAGEVAHLAQALRAGAAAVLAASIFHQRQATIAEVKAYLAECGFPMRRAA